MVEYGQMQFLYAFEKCCPDEKIKSVTPALWRDTVMKAEMYQVTCFSWGIKAVDDIVSKQMKVKGFTCSIAHHVKVKSFRIR